MIYSTKPKDFKAQNEIVSCFVENDGEILLLHRLESKFEGGTWGVPAGKVEAGESINEALIRETWEETHIKLAESDILFFDKVYVRYPNFDFNFYIFHSLLDKRPNVKINNKEHQNFKWISPQQALKENLIRDLDGCIKLYYE